MDFLEESREIAVLLGALLGQFSLRLEHCARECGIPHAQAMALLKIDGPISMRELASRMSCHPSNVTGVSDRLVARGLLETRFDSADRRVKHVHLTPAGLEVRTRLEACVNSGSAPLSRLSDEQRNQLRDLLRSALGGETADLEIAGMLTPSA